MDETDTSASAADGQRVTTVALVGFMGAGKTTVGEALARRLGWRFLDLDRLIEERDGRTVEQIFQQSGEPAFRDRERELLQEAVERHRAGGCVVALGGGAFIQTKIRELLLSNGVSSVFLDATVEELFRRSDQPGVIRPLRGNAQQFGELYEHRRQAYGQADLRVDTGSKKLDAVVEEIISALALVQSSGVHQ